MVEELLVGVDEREFGDYVSVEMLVDGDQLHLLGVCGKYPLLPPFREQGGFLPSHLPADRQEAAVRLAADAVRAVGITSGLVHTELKLTATGPRVIEVNGRLGGFHAELYDRASGVDLLVLGIASACGMPIDPPHAVPASGPVTFHYWNQPPVGGGILRRVEGPALVRQEFGVLDYTARTPVGRALPPSVMTFQLDLLRGATPGHQTMLDLIDRCHAHLRFTVEEPDGLAHAWQPSRSGLCPVE